MGSLPGMLGMAGGAGGTGFAGPQSAQIDAPTTTQQANQAYTGTQQAMGNQQALLNALQGQNGLGNQSQVYGQLQGIASGAVNPAQAQFNQNTSQNVANQAAMMAGQRGAGANVGLMARQAAQQGAATQQQAVGQEATQQAQNQIAAIQGAGNLANTQAAQQIGQTNANVGAQQAEQANLLGGIAAQNQARVGMQSNINQANAGMANTQLQGTQSAIGGLMGGAAMAAMMADGGDVSGGGDSGDLSVPGFVPAQKKSSGGGGAAAMLPMLAMLADGGPAVGAAPSPMVPSQSGASSMFGKFVNNSKTNNQLMAPFTAMGNGSGSSALQSGMTNLIGAMGKKKTSTPNDTDADVIGSRVAGSMQSGTPMSGMAGGADKADLFAEPVKAAKGGVADYSQGDLVKAKGKAQKAVHDGNSYSNDKIPAILSEHEIVLPRSVTMSKDPIRESAKFVAKIISQRKGKK